MQIILFMLPVLILGVAALWQEGLRKPAGFALLLLLLGVRALLFPHETLDYQNFLAEWTAFFRHNGGFRALSYSLGNYNVPYLYFLALFSYIPLPDLYLIKTLSVFFDLVLAHGVLRLVKSAGAGETTAFAGFFLTLALPTVILNGAYWGQCDSIYAALAVWSVALALEGKGAKAMVFAAASFSVKLQAVFYLPVFLIFLFTKRLRWRDIPLFPLTYIIIVLPAVIAGRPFLDTLTLYLNQTGSIGDGLNYNSPSLFALLRVADDAAAAAAHAGIAAAFGFMLFLWLWAYLHRKELHNRSLVLFTLLMCLGIPFLLPHMHDRYFFLSDVFSVGCALIFVTRRNRKSFLLLPVPFLCQFASFLGYYAYLNLRYLLYMSWGARALILALFLLTVFLTLTFRESRQQSETPRENRMMTHERV